MKNYPDGLDDELRAKLERIESLLSGFASDVRMDDRVEISADDYRWLLNIAKQKLDREFRDEGFYLCENCEKWFDADGIVSLEDADLCHECIRAFEDEGVVAAAEA